MSYGMPAAGYVNYLGTNDPTVRPPTPAEQQAAAQAERDRQARIDAAAATAAAQRQRDADITRQQQAAAQARQDALTRQRWEQQQAEQARRDALAAAERTRQQQLEDRAHAEGLLGIGGTGSMAALGGVASGGGGGGGGATFSTAIPTGGGAPGGFAAPSMQTMEDTTAANTAARTQAKERAGLRLQSSMKGLDEAMGSRGIRGSGIQANEAEKLFAGSAADESTASTDILNQEAARRAEIGNLNQGATNQWANANLQASMSAADRLAAGENQLRSLLWNYAMRY